MSISAAGSRRLAVILGASGALVLALVACNALLDNADRDLRPDAPVVAEGSTPADALVAETGADAATEAGPCSTDLQTDKKNCGACGRDCLGGSCVSAKCQPFVFAAATGAQQVFVVDGALYFTDATGTNGGVSWCPVDDCVKPSRIVFYTGAFGLAVDSTGVAVVEPVQNTVYLYPAKFAAGATGSLRTGAVTQPIGVALDATNIYVSAADGDVYRIARTGGGTPARVGNGTAKGGSLALDGTNVYWPSDGTGGGLCAGGCLQFAAKNASDASTVGVSLGRQPRTLHVSGNRLMWTATGGPAQYSGEVSWRENGLGGNEFFYATMLGEPYGITTFGDDVFFTVKSDGTVRRTARLAMPNQAETIATGQSGPRGIAADATAVYWADNVAGAIFKLAR